MSKAVIDAATGLPKLPEGYFWRVGEVKVERLNWDGKKHTETIEGVALIQKITKTTKRSVPVYGDKWYNAWKVVGSRWEEDVQVTEKVYDYERFNQTNVISEGEELPEYAGHHWTEVWGDNGEKKVIKFYTAVNEAGVAFLANNVFKEFTVQEEDRINRERLFGDYPPKVLAEV